MRIFLVGLFVLAVSMRFGTCEAVGTTIAPTTVSDSELAKIYKKNVNYTSRYLGVLAAKYNKFPSQVEKLEKAPPKPFPKILDLIYKNKDYIELKDTLDNVFPWVWKIPRRRKCAEELKEKVQKLVERYDYLMDKDYKEQVERLGHLVDSMKSPLGTAFYALSLNGRPSLENCGEDRYCDMASRFVDEFKTKVEEVENALNPQSDYFKGTYGIQSSLDHEIKDSLIYPINVCLDSYYQRPKNY